MIRQQNPGLSLALPRLVALLHFIDDIDPALAADQLVVPVACPQGLERIANFHLADPLFNLDRSGLMTATASEN
jgi:hypothetical protein